MSAYPTTERDVRVKPAVLQQTVSDIFHRCGMSGADAQLLAGTLVWADLRGIHSHGLLRVPDYVKKLTLDGVDPKGQPRVVRDNGAALVVNGGNSMGQIGSVYAMERAIDRARDTNVALAAVGGSNHCGAMAYFAAMALPHDMIGICATNALPTMAPWGGIDKIVGINPVAIAIPTLSEPPFLYDAAFSASSHGKIRVYHQKGLEVPEGWAFDRKGQPTRDTAEALEGLLQPIGGYKGVGLAMAMGILSSLLSGAGYGTESGNMIDGAVPGADGHFYLAINIRGFADPEHFKARMDGVIRQVHNSGRAAGADRLLIPGEQELLTEDEYRRGGIPLNEETVMGLIASAESTGADASALMQARS